MVGGQCKSPDITQHNLQNLFIFSQNWPLSRSVKTKLLSVRNFFKTISLKDWLMRQLHLANLNLLLLPEMLRKNISICGVWCRAIFCTRDLLAVSIICCSESCNKNNQLYNEATMFGNHNLGQNMSLGHDGEDEWILTIGELSRLVRVLPGVVFLKIFQCFKMLWRFY